jgi:hypothetical protein
MRCMPMRYTPVRCTPEVHAYDMSVHYLGMVRRFKGVPHQK